MHSPRLMIPVLMLALAPALPVLAAAEDPVPWSETFTMPLGGGDRTFVVHAGGSWMLVERADLAAGRLFDGAKDIVVEAKLDQGATGTLRLAGVPTVEVVGDQSLWRARVATDNLYLFGRLTGLEGGRARLTVAAVAVASSDDQRIARRLAGLAATDWKGRLAAVEWIRGQASVQPNQEFWLSSADAELGRIIAAAADIAEQRRDLALLEQAVGWCVELAHDPAKAGTICSREWVSGDESPRSQELRRRLRRLGMEAFQGRWLPRAQALSLEFDQRFAALAWKDAEGYFRLGRWVDMNAELLPQAKERAYRCYQAGLRADPQHAGILSALGAAAPAARADQTGQPDTTGGATTAATPATTAAVASSGSASPSALAGADDQRPGDPEMAKMGFQLAEPGRDGITAWIRPPHRPGGNAQASIDLLFWNERDQSATISYRLDYAGMAITGSLTAPGMRRTATALMVPWRSGAVPRLDLQQIGR
jgi:hypothetical protein